MSIVHIILIAGEISKASVQLNNFELPPPPPKCCYFDLILAFTWFTADARLTTVQISH
jgi:hypothetical protein